MAREIKRVPFFQSMRLVLAASGVGSYTLTASNKSRLVIERIGQITRTTAGGAISDADVAVDINDRVNGSYTKGQVAVAMVGGKASTGFPAFLPAQLVVEPSADIDFDFVDRSGVANTVEMTLIGYEEVLG